MSNSPYGPYDCKGPIIQADRMTPRFRDVRKWQGLNMIPHSENTTNWLGHDRHGTFFTLFGQNYFICNDESQPGTTPYFRDSILSYVRYRKNGEIDPIYINSIGVGQYDAHAGIYATDFFKVSGAEVEEQPDGSFAVRIENNVAQLTYPNIRNLKKDSRLQIKGRLLHPQDMMIEIRRGTALGSELGKIKITTDSARKSAHWTIPLNNLRERDDLCIVFHSERGELANIHQLSFT